MFKLRFEAISMRNSFDAETANYPAEVGESICTSLYLGKSILIKGF